MADEHICHTSANDGLYKYDKLPASIVLGSAAATETPSSSNDGLHVHFTMTSCSRAIEDYLPVIITEGGIYKLATTAPEVLFPPTPFEDKFDVLRLRQPHQ